LSDVRRALQAAISAIDRRDGASAALMVESARSQLGDIDERMADKALAPQRAALERAAAELAAPEFDARRGSPAAATDLTVWLADEPRWAAGVISAERQSLYEPARLAEAER
jgi:hypothetical protein